MDTRLALKSIFNRPRLVLTGIREERKWVPAAIFMVLLLGIHAFVVAVGTYSPNRVSSLIEPKSPVAISTSDSSGNESFTDRSEIDRVDVEPVTRNTSLDVKTTQVGSFIMWTFMLVLLLPVAFAGLCVICFLDAVYFRIVSALLHLEFELKDWFALSVWSRVPGITISVVAVIVAVFVLGRQPNSEELEILTLTRWIDLPEVYHGGENWNIGVNFDHIDAYLIWTILLQTIGFQQWSGKSAAFSFGVVVVPTSLFIAIALLYILLA